MLRTASYVGRIWSSCRQQVKRSISQLPLELERRSFANALVPSNATEVGQPILDPSSAGSAVANVPANPNQPKNAVPVSVIISEMKASLQNTIYHDKMRKILKIILLSDPPRIAHKDFPPILRFVLAQKPRVRTYNLLLSYVAVRNNWYSVMNYILNTMAKQEVKGDTVTLNILITYALQNPSMNLLIPLISFSKPSSARTLLLDILGEEENLFEPDPPPEVVRGIELDERSLLKFFQVYRRYKPSIHLERFQKNAKAMLNTLPPKVYSNRVHDAVIDLLLRNQQHSAAYSILDPKKYSTNTLNSFLRYHASHLSFSRAKNCLRIFKRAANVLPDITSYQYLLKARLNRRSAKDNDEQRAEFLQLWKEMRKLIGNQTDDYVTQQIRLRAYKRGWLARKRTPSRKRQRLSSNAAASTQPSPLDITKHEL